MQRNQSDQELRFKKRARRRLVGAIALVLLMIIVLPMILKDRTNSDQQDEIVITMPNDTSLAASDFDSSIVPVDEGNDVSLEAEQESDVVVEVVIPKQKTEAKPKPKPKAKAKVDVKPQQKKQVKPSETKKVAVKTTKKKGEVVDKFYVQIGVFSEMANVKKLQAKLSDLGYKSTTEKIGTSKGEKIRLRTTTFTGRNEAAIALANIKDSGLTGMVISQK